MDTEKEIKRLARIKARDRRFTAWLKEAGINGTTWWRWERFAVTPNTNNLKRLMGVVEKHRHDA